MISITAVTDHAVEAYAIFYPEATESAVRMAIADGLMIENAIALKMVGRRSPHNKLNLGSYVLHAERTGLFVLSNANEVITFLRFYSWQQFELARRLYPEGRKPPMAKALWVNKYWTPSPTTKPR